VRLTRELLTAPYRATDGRLFKPPVQRFLYRLHPEGDCLVWVGARNNRGYGQMGIGDDRLVYTHRISWALSDGVLEEADQVLHRCDNPPCAKRSHLFLGDPKSNSDDMWAKGRGSRPPRKRPTDPAILAEVLRLSRIGLSSTRIAEQVPFAPSHIRKLVRDAIRDR
jgi:hypothetical protein